LERKCTNQRKDTKHRAATRGKSRRKRRHLCAPPALLPVLLLQLCVLHSQLEAGQLGHERLVTHMERVRDRELERGRQEEDNDESQRCGEKRRAEKQVKRVSRREGLIEEERIRRGREEEGSVVNTEEETAV